MGTNSRIYLPNHAHPKKIYEVVQKHMGHTFKNTTFKPDKLELLDVEKPASEQNPWHLQLIKKDLNSILATDLNHYSLEFTDLAESRYSVLIFVDLEDDPLMIDGKKMLAPPSEIVWCAVGECLVRFFGGTIIYNDQHESYYYTNKKAAFPKQTKEQSSDNRWFQYYNALKDVQKIKKQDLNSLIDRGVASTGKRTEKLLDFLDRYENITMLHDQLENQLKGKATNNNSENSSNNVTINSKSKSTRKI